MRHKQQRLLEQNIQHLEIYIKEHELKISPEEMILSITDADPDWQNFKNSKWLIKNLLNKNFLWEDIESGKSSKAFDTLSRFLNIRKQWSDSAIKDIQAYKGLSGIAEAIRPFEITKSMGELKREEKAKIYSETIVVYDKNDYLVVIPKTQEASCFWGRNTEWCTASTQSTNYFNDYHPYGPLIIAITPDNKKYQFHIDSDPMDENDKPIKNITDSILVDIAIKMRKYEYISRIKLNALLKQPNALDNIFNGDPAIIAFMPTELLTIELWEKYLDYNRHALIKLPESSPFYFELCHKYISKNPDSISQIHPTSEYYVELCNLAIEKIHSGKIINYIKIDALGEDKTQIYKKLLMKGKGAEEVLKKIPKKDRTEEICNLAIQQDIKSLLYIPKYLITHEMCEKVLNKNPHLLREIPIELRTKELCELAVQKTGYALQHVPRHLRTREMCLLAFKNNESPFCHIPNEYLDDEIYQLALQQDIQIIDLIPEKYLTKEIYEKAQEVNPCLFRYIPREYVKPETYKLALDINYEVFPYIDSETPDYYDMCEHLLQLPKILGLQYIPNNYEHYNKLAEFAIQCNPLNILSMKPTSSVYLPLARKAIEMDSSTFRDIIYKMDSQASKTEQERIMDINNQDVRISFNLPDEYTPEGLCELAVRKDGLELRNVPLKYKTSPICKLAVQQNPEAFEHVPENLKEDIKPYAKEIIAKWMKGNVHQEYIELLEKTHIIDTNEKRFKFDLS